MKVLKLFYLFLLCIAVTSVSCFHARQIKKIEASYGKLLPVRISVSKYINHFSDSCRISGIDTILTFWTYYSGSELYPPVDYSQLGEKYSYGKYEPESFSTPGYIFWVKNGHFFLKKADQFGSYKTLEREFYQEYPLYDFFRRNRIELNNEAELSEKHDSIHGHKFYAYVSPSAPGSYYQKHFAPNTFYVGIYYDTLSFSKTIYKYKYQPLIQASDSSNYPFPYANDSEKYYQNQQLKMYQWINLIQAELFDAESRNLFMRMN